MMDKIALVIAIIGGINWGLIGLFQFDLVAWIFGGAATAGARIVYVIIGLAALWCIHILCERIVSRRAEVSA